MLNQRPRSETDSTRPLTSPLAKLVRWTS